MSEAYTLKAMANNYRNGHSWDHLDGEVCIRAADEIKKLAVERDEFMQARNELVENNYMLHNHLSNLRWERDEGLAREAVLSGKVETMRRYNNEANAQNDALRQRLAEAEKLLRSTRGYFAIEGTMGIGIDAFLVSPSCADGEKAE
jgi:hypothetical protein